MSEDKGTAIFVYNLARIMRDKDVTQTDIAKALKISQATVSLWANGISYPRIKTMTRLAEYLGVPVTALTSTDEPIDPQVAEFLSLVKNLSDEDKEWLLATLKRLPKAK